MDIFGNISNETRRSILFKLEDNPMKISQIANEMGISMQAIEKHKKKLLESQLIKKQSNDFALTELGRALLCQINSLEFLQKNHKIFDALTLKYFPVKFVERIGELCNFEKIEGFVNSIERYRQFLNETKKFAKIVTPQVSLDVYREGMNKFAKNNVNVYYIIGQNTIIPKGWLRLSRSMNERNMISSGRLHRRISDHVYVMIYLSENGALLSLPDMNGRADPSIVLASRDNKFREWCEDYFNYLWERTDTFAENKIHET